MYQCLDEKVFYLRALFLDQHRNDFCFILPNVAEVYSYPSLKVGKGTGPLFQLFMTGVLRNCIIIFILKLHADIIY